jgi:hypothetical protein
MALCVQADTDGNLLGLPAVPLESCTGFVMLTPEEYAAVSQSWVEPLTLEQGTAIGVAVFVAFTVAWGLKVLRRFVQDTELNEGMS